MKLVNNQFRGVIFKPKNYSYYYAGIINNFGPVFVASNKKFKQIDLTSYSPKYFALKIYSNLCLDRGRFEQLKQEISYQNTRNLFVQNLEKWQTPMDVDNMFANTKDITKGAAEQAHELGGKRKSLTLFPNVNIEDNVEENIENTLEFPKINQNIEINDYVNAA